jgi:hypothetical protein
VDLWTEASRDIEADEAALRMATAKVAVAGLWPFLALSQSRQEFDHRLALAQDHIANAVPVDLLVPVVASLREDFQLIKQEAAKDAEGEEDADDEDGDGKPDWLQKKIKGKESALYFHAGLGSWVAWSGYAGDPEPDPGDGPSHDEMAREEWEHERASTDRPFTENDDPDEEASWRDLGQRGPTASRRAAAYWHAGESRWVTAAVDDSPGGGNPWYFTGGPEAGPNTGQTGQFPPHPTGADPVDPLNQMFPMQPSPWTVPPGGEWKEAPMNFNPPNPAHSASRLPFEAADRAEVGATDTCANCANPMKKIQTSWGKTWTHTGPHGAEADDACPGAPRGAIREAAAGNPNYFGGGGEGVSGDGEDPFPEDLAQEDPDNRVNELYGQTPVSGGFADNGGRVARRRHAADSDPLQGIEFDSPQEADRWSRAQNGEQQDSRASTTMAARRPQFYDPSDPGVRVVAEASPFSGGGNPFTPGGEGGAQDEAAPPMGMNPATTPPRQMPGGGGMPQGGDAFGQGANTEASDQAAKQQQGGGDFLAFRRTAEGLSRDLGTDDDPTGLGDEYRERTVEGPLKTRPRQPAEHRNVNTPQRPSEAIPTIGSPSEGPAEEEEGRREAARVAARAVRELVGA